MRDVLEEILLLEESSAGDTRRYRRQVIEKLVWALLDIIELQRDLNGSDHRALIMRLTTIVGTMTAEITQADDATFSTIIREAVIVVSALRSRQLQTSPLDIH
ncbi:hypothetical protein G6L94_32525 [Agrobacterium rhizogenes]|uniref:hypothetical protein n=1 Tax=Rhizobium rhizogenes TaxID=359 RepID=UPI00080F8078|nr:hypothetical protein [Rhizobium rhizogenes]OCJ22466.1 hypothetical protein A6U88_29120 [Agrobacterium sp. B131/95]OCJ28543.1 hypothetical protein A6U89_28445 [Agrobacterium sp. B133/95]NTI46359.1 hypothetical protein [Rhizobium rhizogenes]NTI53043.1 hypothetical protein [Rhizobium rhizogenes]NTI98416.1 hypothetical protein [Rhizobium rhizogenes]